MRIFTSALLAVLTDLAHTASNDPDLPDVAGIELHTGRGEFGSDPGITDLLCGSSTDRFVVGHTYARCDGQLAAGAPILLPVAEAKAIVDVFKKHARNELHALDIRYEAPRTLVVSEDPNLVDDGLSLRLTLGDADDYPAAGVYRTLDRELRTVVARRGAGPTDPAPRTVLAPTALEPFIKITKRRKISLHLFRTHQDEVLHVQIGDHYRGALLPVRVDADDPGDPQRADVTVHAPDLDDDDAADDDLTDDADDDMAAGIGATPAADPTELDQPTLTPAGD